MGGTTQSAASEPGVTETKITAQVAAESNNLADMSALTPAATPAEAAKAAAEIPGLQPSHAETAAPGPTSQPAAVSATAAGSANTTAGATDVSAQAASTPATEASPDMGAPSAALPVAGGAATTDAADTSSMIKVVATAPHPAEGGDGAFPVNSPAVDNEEDDGQAAEGTEDHGQPISKNQLKKRAKLQRCDWEHIQLFKGQPVFFLCEPQSCSPP